MGMKMITVTIPWELDARAAEEARRRGISKSFGGAFRAAGFMEVDPRSTAS